MKRLKAATVFIWDIWKKKVEIFTMVKIQNIFGCKAFFIRTILLDIFATSRD